MSSYAPVTEVPPAPLETTGLKEKSKGWLLFSKRLIPNQKLKSFILFPNEAVS
jgi:hypothetical protein